MAASWRELMFAELMARMEVPSVHHACQNPQGGHGGGAL